MSHNSFLVILLLLLTTSGNVGQTVVKEPSSSSEYYYRGLSRQSAGDVEGAISDFARSIAIDETVLAVAESREVKVRLAQAYCQRGNMRMKKLLDIDGAQSDFDRAIFHNPTHIVAYQQRAVVRQLKNDPEGSKSDLSKAEMLASEMKANDQSPPLSVETIAPALLLSEASKIPPDSKVYIVEWNGFENDLQESIRKQKVPLVVVADRSSADFELRAGYYGGGSFWTLAFTERMVVPYQVYDDVIGQLVLINIRTGHNACEIKTWVVGAGVFNPRFTSARKRVADKLARSLKQKIAPDLKSR